MSKYTLVSLGEVLMRYLYFEGEKGQIQQIVLCMATFGIELTTQMYSRLRYVYGLCASILCGTILGFYFRCIFFLS